MHRREGSMTREITGQTGNCNAKSDSQPIDNLSIRMPPYLSIVQGFALKQLLSLCVRVVAYRHWSPRSFQTPSKT